MNQQPFAEYFQPVAHVIEEFSLAHRAHLLRYEKDGPLWSVCFGHPLGGQAKIDISVKTESHLRIESTWWIDVWPELIRNLRRSKPVSVLRQPGDVEEALLFQLRTVLAWEIGAWTSSTQMLKIPGMEMSKEQFDRYSNPWPTLFI